MIRKIEGHEVNAANRQIEISALPDGPGGAPTGYKFKYGNTNGGHIDRIYFQNGAIAEHGVNGLTHEALLAIIADRLRCFQAGPYACRQNALALTKIEEALHWLHDRTMERERRGVEGTHAI